MSDSIRERRKKKERSKLGENQTSNGRTVSGKSLEAHFVYFTVFHIVGIYVCNLTVFEIKWHLILANRLELNLKPRAN